jgi:hypothetical protein
LPASLVIESDTAPVAQTARPTSILDDGRLDRFLTDLASHDTPPSSPPRSGALSSSPPASIPPRNRSLTYSPDMPVSAILSLITTPPLRRPARLSLDAEVLREATVGEELVLTPSTEALFGSVGRRTLAGARATGSP